jgi:hypothetical protein
MFGLNKEAISIVREVNTGRGVMKGFEAVWALHWGKTLVQES